MRVPRYLPNPRCLAAAFAVILLAACSNQSGSASSQTDPQTGSSSKPAVKTTFGDLSNVCGPGSAKIANGQNGGSTLKLGTPSDHGSEAAPGTNEELLDAAVAFGKWCNALGGIKGLKIETVDLDGKLFQVPPAMEKACSQVFAMVGGQWVFDEQEYPRFNQCKMVNFPSGAVSDAARSDPNTVQAVPSSPSQASYGWLKWAADAHPDDVKSTAMLYADIPTTVKTRDNILQQMAYVGIKNVKTISYSANGEANWAPFAQRMKDGGIKMMTFVGSPGNYALLAKAMTDVGYKPNVVLNAPLFYTDLLLQPGNVKNSEGMYANMIFAPFEEASANKALQDYIDMMQTYNPKGLKAQAGMQGMSAFLLFAKAANACIDSNGGVLERQCVVTAAKKITSWTGGGLHAETNPSGNAPSKCVVIVQVKGGKWTRTFPQLGSPDDSGRGFHCYTPGLVATPH